MPCALHERVVHTFLRKKVSLAGKMGPLFREVELTSTGRKPKSGSASPLQEKFSRVVSSCLPSQRDNGYSRVGLTDE